MKMKKQFFGYCAEVTSLTSAIYMKRTSIVEILKKLTLAYIRLELFGVNQLATRFIPNSEKAYALGRDVLATGDSFEEAANHGSNGGVQN